MEDALALQKSIMEQDKMSGLKSRFAYSEKLRELNQQPQLPANMAAVMIDVNGLKRANDTLGHEAGDELIAGVGRCIRDTFTGYGESYRTGGDEFVVILQTGDAQFLELLCAILNGKVKSWSGTLNRGASVSCGYASAREFPGYPIEKLVGIADKRMYEQKANYYRIAGRDRRRR